MTVADPVTAWADANAIARAWYEDKRGDDSTEWTDLADWAVNDYIRQAHGIVQPTCPCCGRKELT